MTQENSLRVTVRNCNRAPADGQLGNPAHSRALDVGSWVWAGAVLIIVHPRRFPDYHSLIFRDVPEVLLRLTYLLCIYTTVSTNVQGSKDVQNIHSHKLSQPQLSLWSFGRVGYYMHLLRYDFHLRMK